jgi:3-hydroxyisobutyrate dehydrogenase-like beta-hydroxyacid dehydrogenase
MMASFSEGICLADKAKLDTSVFVEIMGLGAMACGMYKGKGPNMIKGDFPTQFPLKHQQKDLRLAIELGEQVGQPLPVAKAANATFERALPTASDQDFSAVLTVTKGE